MKMPYFRATVAAMIAVAGFAFCLPARASTFTVGGSGNTFTVSRSGAGVAAAETVRYRTVPLSAFPGQHYTEKSGTLVFAPGQPSTNITVSAATLSDGAYMYQTNVVRTYRFEILDEGGFPITNATRDVSTGLRQFKADKVSKSVTDLVTFSGGNFSSGMPSGKYLDVSYTPPSSQVETSGTLAGYVLIDDSYDYAQKPAMVSTAGLINSTGAQADYLAALDYKIYATVCFTEKERDDGYQYLQIVAGTSSASYDGADPNGQVNDPANSVYKVCFEFADGSNAEGKAFFPHRGTDTTEFSLSTGKLWQQKYKDGYAAGSSGSVVLPVSTSYITTRFDAGGDNDDTWGYKDFFVRMALVDNGQPTLYNNSTAAISVSPGPYSKGNAFYISVPFNEIVFSSGVKTISTTWGSADYCSGDGSNVITFKGTITADAGTVLSITGGTCNFRDFFDNYFQGSLNKTFNGKTVSASHAYPITYDLGGGTLPANAPTSYTYDAAVSLVQPTRTGYAFAGWTGTDLGGPTNEVTVAAGSTGDRSYVATWEANAYRVRFNDNDGSGATRDQEFIYDEPQSLDPAIARTGYDFAGWSTNANGAVVYADGASVSNLTAVNYGSVMLYAQWTAHSYTVHFDPGGGEGSMPDQSFTYDTPQALSSNAFTRTGYAFIGWSVAGTTYPDGATVLNLTNAQDAVVSLVAKWGIPVPYIDAGGTERICADYTVLTNAASGVAYGGGRSGWYVVTNAVTISGNLFFADSTAHLILCDGATLAVTNANGNAIQAGNLFIYGQTNGTGTVTATGHEKGIYANGGSVTINGGTVTAEGRMHGISADGDVTINGGTVTAIATATGGRGISAGYSVTINGGTVTAIGKQYGIYAPTGIILGWTNPADSITASSYYNGGHGVCVKSGQRLTDGSAIYKNDVFFLSDLAGKTLRPVYSITLPEGVVAGGVVTQNGTTAYAIAGTNVTLSAAAPGYVLGSVTVNGVPLAPVDGTYTFTASDASITVTATVCIPVPYIDADGTEQMCASYTVLTNAAGGVYGTDGEENWYVVTNAVTISGGLYFNDNTAHLILCDGATLAVTNANGNAVEADNLTIYGQTNGTGTVTANGKDDYGISASGYVTINGGTVTATGSQFGIIANFITLGWTNPTDSITASRYGGGGVRVKDGQRLTDGSAIYKAQIPSLSAIAGKTLRPAYSISLPEGVVAGGVVTQNGTTAYAIAGTNVTLNAAPGYYGIGNVTVDGVPLEPVAGVYSFAASADVTIAATVTPVTYVVRFAAGGGEGSMPDQSFTYGELQALSSNAFTRTGYAFAGWSVAGTTYPDGATVLNLTNAQDAVVSLVAKWGIPVPYIDADGIERICADYTILTNAAGGVAYGANGATAWYVVTNAVTISGQLRFNDYAAHLILCDGATLAVTNANGRAIEAGNLTIYGQTNGTGTVTANGKDGCGIFASYYVTINGGTVTANGYGNGIYAHGSVTINGGTVTATCSTGGYGIFAHDDITLGWTNPTDSITASSYYAGDGSVRVKTDQRLTDGSAIYTDYLGTHPTTLKGKTLRPAYSITLPEGVVAGGVVRQDGTTAYAIAGDIVTLSAATPGYAIGTVTVNGVPLEPVAGTYSFTASADVTIAATVTPVTYIVRFDAGADGVTGSMPDQSVTYDVSQPLTANAFTRAGYTFAGWLRADGAIYPDGANVDRLYVRYIVRYADNKEDTWKRFDRMPYPGKTNDDYHIGDGALQNTENGNGLNLYTGFENSAWNPDEPATAELISQNSAWFDEHDARNGVSMKLIEDFPNFYKEPVVVAQDGVVTLTAIWHPPVPYIDADGTERLCTDYTVLTDATDDVMYGEWNATAWYVVTNAVTISGQLYFRDSAAHLILCDGATLTVTNTNDNSETIGGSGLTIYGQANGTGAVVANGDCGIAVAGSVTINGGNVTAIGRSEAIAAGYSLTINGGRVTATGNNGGIFAQKGTITLGWTNPTDSITASSYYAGSGSVRVKSGQRLTDGSAIYKDTDYLGPSPTAIAGKTLRPYIYTPTYPAYLGLPADPADDTEGDAVIRANYDAWALRYGYDALGAYEAAFLLNVAPWATPIELRIAGIEVVEGGARVRVTCRAGASAEAGAVDLSQINGVISVSAGDDLVALVPMAIPAANVSYDAGVATIFVPSSAGTFIQARILVATP